MGRLCAATIVSEGKIGNFARCATLGRSRTRQADNKPADGTAGQLQKPFHVGSHL